MKAAEIDRPDAVELFLLAGADVAVNGRVST